VLPRKCNCKKHEYCKEQRAHRTLRAATPLDADAAQGNVERETIPSRLRILSPSRSPSQLFSRPSARPCSSISPSAPCMASVIVMPASPVAQLRASPSLSTATASTAPATPRLSLVDADGGPPRASSMYGRPGSGAWTAVERQGSRDSYAAAGGLPTVAPDYPAQTSKRPSSRLVAPPEPRQQPSRLSAVDSARSSAVIYTLDTDDAYAYDAPAAYTPPHRQSSLHAPLSARPPASRPTSTRAPPIPRSLADEHLLAPAARPSSSTYADDPMARPASGSRVLSSQSLDPRAMPLPLSTRSSFAPSRHASPGPPLPATPPPSTPARDRLSVHDASPGSIPGPSSPRKFGAGPSTHSLVPSAGEDSDSFFVRATYAELDQSGVKGDGFVEGVERTRARVGPSRASELLAEQARGDGSERSAELGPAEQRVLASLDRYGFFVVANHDRLVALPVNAFAKPLTPLPTGATAGPAQPPHLPALPQGAPSPKEAERISKWGRMLEPQARDKGGNVLGWSVRAPKERKFRGRVYKGIPDRWRAAAWPLMMARFSRSGDAEMARMRGEYRAALELPSQYDVQIDLDVPRTISGHVMFRTRYGMGSAFFPLWPCLP
jgi:hypothetical protein